MNDFINRDAAIRATDGELTITGEENMAAVAEYITGVVEKLKALPGQPEIIRCHDCEHHSGSYCHYKYSYGAYVRDNHYCGWAERRTDEL